MPRLQEEEKEIILNFWKTDNMPIFLPDIIQLKIQISKDTYIKRATVQIVTEEGYYKMYTSIFRNDLVTLSRHKIMACYPVRVGELSDPSQPTS